MTEEGLRALFSEYQLTYLKPRDEGTTITAAMRAYGAMWFRKQGPTAILSSKSIYNHVMRCIIPAQRVPVISGIWLKGFKFCDAGWFPYEPLEGTDWIVMLNENAKDDPTRNGFYLFSVKPKNRLGKEDL